MANFLELKEAAAMLGMSPDELVEKRSAGEVRGFRDGASWKFKTDDLERYADQEGIPFGGGVPAAPDSADEIIGFDDDLDDLISVGDLDMDESEDGGADSILVSEEELGHSDESTSSTIIGKNAMASPADSDLQLAVDSASDVGDLGMDGDLDLADGGLGDGSDSDVSLMSPGESDVHLVADSQSEELSLSAPGISSDLSLDVGGAPSASNSDLSLDVMTTSNSDLELAAGAASEDLAGASGLGLATESELTLGSSVIGSSAGGRSDLNLESNSPSSDLTLGSETMGSALELGDDDDDLTLGEDEDDLLLGGSGLGSDVTLGSDSGINLSSPSDSGLSLEEPMDLGGGAVSSLELPEDDDDVISLESEADPDEATQLKQDEEFLLSPSDENGLDGGDDSGSQVIALEDSEAFEEVDAAGMIQDGGFGDALVAQDPMGGMGAGDMLGAAAMGGAPVDALGGEMAPATAPGAVPGGAAAGAFAPTVPEVPYSVWNVLSLVLILMVLSVTGMFMMDIVRNMWGWTGSTGTGTSLMDAVVSAIGLRP